MNYEAEFQQRFSNYNPSPEALDEPMRMKFISKENAEFHQNVVVIHFEMRLYT